MAGQQVERKFYPIPFGGVWDESVTPSKVGPSGLTACRNLTYRRFGAWGKRSGSALAYRGTSAIIGPLPGSPVSAVRWYRALPTAQTKLVIGAQGSLYTGGDPGTALAPAGLTQIANFSAVASTPLSFASAYDPSANTFVGSDILIVCGATSPNAFAKGTFSFLGAPTAGQTFTVDIKNPAGSTVTTATYTALPSDTTPDSIAQAVANLINTCDATAPGGVIAPFLNNAIPVQTPSRPLAATVEIAALDSGATGNSIQYKITYTGAGCVAGPPGFTNLTGGGASIAAPLKYDGSKVSGLSGFITQPFTGCVAWHDHVWFWGDSSNPDTLYAADINQPTQWSFMTQYGGYQIGRGDGDSAVQTCVPIGNILYVFKRNNIYAITGYDFQSGEYQFNVQPAIQGFGIPAPECATAMNDQVVFWSGSEFDRLAPGAFVPEFIGRPIPLTSGKVANGDQTVIRMTAGNFRVSTHLNDSYQGPGPATDQELLTNVLFAAVDLGDGLPDNVLAYDDDASHYLGNYAWAPWSGWSIAAWAPFTGGLNSAGTGDDPPLLFFIPPPDDNVLAVYQFGADAGLDSGVPIPWMAQTGWCDLGTGALQKELHRVLLDVEATPGATFNLSITASGPVNGSAATVYPTRLVTSPATVGTANEEAAQTLVTPVNPFLKGYKYLFGFSEEGNETSFEITGLLADYVEQAFQP